MKQEKEIKRYFKYSNYFITATFVGIVILVSTIICSTLYLKNISHIVLENQAKVEIVINEISDKTPQINNYTNENEKNYSDFLKEYYTIQANWLNIWLTALAIIMAVLGIMIPICFVKFLENKEKEMDRIIEETRKQKDEMQLNVDGVQKKSEQMSESLIEVNKKSEQMSKDLAEVKDYVTTVKSESKYNEAIIEFNKHKYDEAIKILYSAKCIKNSVKICSLLGICFYKKNYLQKAIDLFTEGISIDKQDITCLNIRAKCYFLKKMYKEALKDIEILIKIEPKNDYNKLYRMLILLHIDKELNEFNAKELIRNIRKKYQDFNYIILNLLGILAKKLDDSILAKELLQKSISLDNNPYYQFYVLSDILIQEGNYKQALNNLKKYIKIDQKNENMGIYDAEKEKWIEKLTNIDSSEESYELIKYIETLKVSRKMGKEDKN